MNFVTIKWAARMPARRHDKMAAILEDRALSWAARGLGAYLTTTRQGLRFPNTIFDGTMDALEELKRWGYLTIQDANFD